VIEPMSIVTRPRTPVPAVPEPGSAPAREPWPAPPRPGGGPVRKDRRRRVLRRRATLTGAVLCALIAIVAALNLTGSGDVPPTTGAARVVPADVLAYVHLSTDASRPAVGRARALGARFPDYPLAYAAAINRLSAIVGGSSSVDFATGIRPWLGKEAALALLDTQGASAPSLLVVDVSNRPRAQRFLTRAGAAAVAAYDGVRILGYPSGTELAFVTHYLVVGPDTAVRAAIAAGTGRARSLAAVPAYQRAAAGEPAGRVLDAYLPAAGVRRLLEPRGGVVGAIATMLDRPSLEGTAISLSAVTGGAQVQIHSALSARSHPIGFAPTLQSVLPAGSTLMLDVDGLNRAAPQLLRAAATVGFAGNVAPLLARLGAALTAQGVNVHAITSIFHEETAVALSPGPTPSLVIVARTSNQAATQTEMAGLEAPLTALFPAPSSGPGQIPGLVDHQVGGVTVHELGLGPGLQVDYAVFNGLVVVSTSITAIDQVASRSRSLAGDNAYKTVLSDQPEQVSSVLFSDFSQLLRLGEQTGLTSGARIRELLPDLAKVSTIGLSSANGKSDTTTELRLEIP
jgi:Protein of unknown function (DUF3352)